MCTQPESRPVKLATSTRIRFSELAPDHLATFHRLVVDPHVRRYLFDGHSMSRAWCADAIEQSQACFARGGVGLYLLHARDNPHEAIGFGGFWVFEELGPEPQLLYALHGSAAGRGFATEAASTLIDHMRAPHAGAKRIVSAVDAPNVDSIRVLEKLGFRRTGEAPGAFGHTVLFELPEGLPPRILFSERLTLRPLSDDDLASFAALNADPEVMQFLPGVLSRAESDALAARIREAFDRQGYGLWALDGPGGMPVAGFVGLMHTRFEAAFTPAVEVGWRLAREHWGKGYASEAARASVRAGFVHLGLDEVVSFTAAQNQRSRRVMEKLGMRRDPSDDFDHPALPEGHPLRRHVLYRLHRPA